MLPKGLASPWLLLTLFREVEDASGVIPGYFACKIAAAGRRAARAGLMFNGAAIQWCRDNGSGLKGHLDAARVL
jgi:hypothetical protein